MDRDPAPRSNCANVGAASELIVCVDLMSQGYHVYRCESPTAPFDLVAHKNGELLRVEVKTITFGEYAPMLTWPRNDQWDLLAVVNRDTRKVHYFASGTSATEARAEIRKAYGWAESQFVTLPCGHTVIHVARHEAQCRGGPLPRGRRPLLAEAVQRGIWCETPDGHKSGTEEMGTNA